VAAAAGSFAFTGAATDLEQFPAMNKMTDSNLTISSANPKLSGDCGIFR
jgi:hypothetical protein